MRLTSFMAQGFKNLVAPVKLEGLGPINVLHGANNVGKSNLLKAIEVLARLIGATPGEVTDASLASGGVVAADLFNYAVPGPIHLSAAFAIEPEELVLAGFPQPALGSLTVSTEVSLPRLQGAVLSEPRAFRTADGSEYALMAPGDAPQMTTGRAAPLARRYADFFKSRLIGARAPYVGVDRRPGEVSDAPLIVGGLAPAGSIDAPRAPTRVSSEGTLRLPERIRKAVGVEHGGNLSFVDTGEGVVEMMSVDTFLKRAGLDDDDA